MTEDRGKEFQIGLAMSGAVSAGAYTAGVFDFLIQALDEWEKARNGPDAGKIPNHRVGLKVMSGASAGAITAAIGAVALADAKQEPARFDPQKPVPSDPEEAGKGIKCYLPRLYEIWVEKPGLVAEGNEQSDFLQTSDLDGPPDLKDDFSRTSHIQRNEENPQPVVSLLNSRLLDEIAKSGISVTEVVKPPSFNDDAGKAKPTKTQRAYIAETLHIYMTLSNLRGVPYSVPFDSGANLEKSGKGNKGPRENCYHMISHGDRVHYAVTGLGTWNSESVFAKNDKPRSIDVAKLIDDPDKQWKDYAICALASAAFPVGLAPRLIGATLGTDPKTHEYDPERDEYEGRRLPIDVLHRDQTICPAWLPDVRSEEPFWFTTADGGIIDNDPFEYARFSLKDSLEDAAKKKKEDSVAPEGPVIPEASALQELEDRLPFDLKSVDRAVIMISPFPELNPIAPEGQPASDVVSILSTLLPALIDQARFKPSEIILAADPKHGSRYLIGPSRVTSDGKEQRYGIASGLLGGFGGFIARTFRDHDYQLGRRNCQRFLQTSFALPADNEIIKNWQKGVDKTEFKAIKTDEEKRRKAPDTYCIIPLFGTAVSEVALLPWPRISPCLFKVLQTRIAERFDGVAPRLLAQNVAGPLWVLLWFAVRPFPQGIGLIRGKVLNFVQAYIQADLVRRDMIDDWELPTSGVDGDDVRLVLAELINPSYDLRNIAGLCKATGLDRTTVEAVLTFCQGPAASGKNFEVWRAPWTDKDAGALYTLKSRKPAWYSWFLWRYCGRLVDLVFGRKRSGIWLSKPAVDKPGV